MKTILIILLCFSTSSYTYGQYEQDSLYVAVNYTKQEVNIPMRDGVKLFTAIYAPRDQTEKHPIVMVRTPYSCAPYGKNFNDVLWNRYFRYLARENYIFVFQDVRGRWMSEGEFMDVRPFNPNKKDEDIDEASDSYDAIDWLVRNVAGNNGNVGVLGTSYPGFYTAMAALSGHPALKAVSPKAPVTDWFIGDDFHHNGAFFLQDAYAFYGGGFGYPRKSPTTKKKTPAFPLPKNDNYEFHLRMGALKNYIKLAGDSLPFWRDMFAHPDLDQWWKNRNIRNFVADIKPAVITTGGLFDAEDCFGAWNLYKSIEQKNSKNHFNKLVMGPWYHGQWNTEQGWSLGNIYFGSNTSLWFQNNIEIPFLNYYLKGKGDLNSLAEATIFFTGSNQWKQLPQWPPAGKKDTPIYLNDEGKLTWTKPAKKNNFSEYISDPSHPVPYTEDVHAERTVEYMNDDQRFASRRSDVLTYETELLKSDVTLAGEIVANLFVSINTTDADFVVKLIDVFPEDFNYPSEAAGTLPRYNGKNYPMGGYEMLVRGEIMRGRYRNSFEKPQAFSPGKVEQVRFALPDVAHVFRKGHKIMIQIQSSWFPLADRNPQQFVNIYTCEDADFKKATVKVHHNATHASSIILPVAEQ